VTARQLAYAITSGLLAAAGASPSLAAEFGFSAYGLGGAGFGAGVTPPPGTYVTTVAAYYEGEAGGTITLGGVTLDAGVTIDFFTAGLNGLYVPQEKVLGGNLGLSVTVPVGYIDIDAELATLRRSTDGAGLADIVGRVQLGWQHGDFAHTVYVQGLAPTGRYDTGFNPNIGLNRPAVDVGWGFTWMEPNSKLQFNGTVGFTFSFENDKTDYDSGNDFHFEWAIGREFAPGLMLGVAGYDYRQLTGDSGTGATLGPFEGSVDAIGPSLSYTTLIGTTPLILAARHYREFNAERRFEGSMSIMMATMRF